MRVEQQNQILEALQQAAGKDVKTASGIVAEKAKTTKSVSDRQTSIQMKDTTYLNPAREEKKSIAEKIEESSGMDAFDRKNQMAVLSNTTSEEDYAKMQEEGFSLDSTDSHTIITVTDKIKMQLAKAGKEVFGDDLDAAELEAMTGSVALANQLEQAFKEADLPATDENISIPAYTDKWEEGEAEYLRMLCSRLIAMKKLLTKDGCLWVHLDWHISHYTKILLDEIFGHNNFVNEIVWTYKSGGSSKRHFSRKHDTLLFYSKTKQYYFKPQKEKSCT